MTRQSYFISHIVKIMGIVRSTIVPFSYTFYCCDILQCTDDSKDIIGCDRNDGYMVFGTVVHVSRNSGGYFVEIENAAESIIPESQIYRLIKYIFSRIRLTAYVTIDFLGETTLHM